MTHEAERRRERTLSWLLRHRREAIVAEWQSGVCRLLEGRELPGPVLKDSIPALLDRIADHVEQSEGVAADVGEASRLHPIGRLDRGFDLDEAVSEYTLLRTTILERVHVERVRLTHRELAALNDAIDDAVLQLIVRFNAARERTVRAIETIASAGVGEGGQLDGLLGALVEAFRHATPAADAVAIFVREGERLRVRASEAFNAAVLKAALDCVIAMDASGVVTEWNPAAERTFGYTREEAIGRTVAELVVPPPLREAHRAGLARYLATGEGPLMDRRVEITAMRKDGREIPVELTIARVPLPGPPRFTAYLRDLTERAAAERTRERFVGILGHDLRNPLGAIHLGVQILEASELSAPQVAIVRRIGSSAARMTRMVQELLDFTRGRLGGGIPVTRLPADLDALATRVIDEAKLAHPGRAVRLDVHGDPSGEWDAERLMQVISNLVGNALQHGHPQEPVRVRVDGTAADVVLSVSNAVECPPAELTERLFDPFRRGEADATPAGGLGLGLGLYITREIVAAHEGRIDARCDEADGFTVTAVLPRRAAR